MKKVYESPKFTPVEYAVEAGFGVSNEMDFTFFFNGADGDDSEASDNGATSFGSSYWNW